MYHDTPGSPPTKGRFSKASSKSKTQDNSTSKTFHVVERSVKLSPSPSAEIPG